MALAAVRPPPLHRPGHTTVPTSRCAPAFDPEEKTMNSIAIRTLTASALAVTAILGLAACSEASPDTSPSPTASTSAAAETIYNECIDGSLQVFDDGKDNKPVKFGDCDGASIISSERTITLGTVPTLTIEGQKNTVEASGVKTLTVLGDGNTVAYKGDAPKIDDQGKGNTIKPAA